MELQGQLTNPNVLSMKDLLARTIFDLPKVGSTVEGEIISVSKNSVLIDLDSLGTGIVYPGEFYDNATLQKALKPGQRVAAILLDLENEDGWRELSLKRAQLTTAWQDIKNKKESGEVITTKIININKGGLIVEINGVPGFLPLSQLAPEHYPKVEGGDTTKIVQALQKFRNIDIQVKIIDYFEDENRLIVSEKAINDRQLLAEVAKFKVGDVVSGVITDVTDFGAFVRIIAGKDSQFDSAVAAAELSPLLEKKSDLGTTLKAEGGKAKINLGTGTLEGLIHISEIDWKLIDNPRDFLAPGQNVEAKIIEIDGTKISLSLKALKPDPWQKVEEKYSVGQKLAGEVTRLTNFGAFIRLDLDEEIFGLVPASEFGNLPAGGLHAGDRLKVAIVSIDPKEHKMLLTPETAETISAAPAPNEEKTEKAPPA